MKNAHLSRGARDSPHPSPCRARGRLVAAYIPTKGFACLPKPRRRQGRLVPPVAGGIFDQPEERLFNKRLGG